MAARQLINDPKNVVDEMLEGLTYSQAGLQKLDGYNVIVRSSLDKNKVNIISGGGSGHEPSHAGWVGPGMLSAAVAGPVFASPASISVLAAIMHVTGPGGCLVIVKNYTGDRLWFGLACEQAKAAGLNVELVVVGDDCALADRGLGPETHGAVRQIRARTRHFLEHQNMRSEVLRDVRRCVLERGSKFTREEIYA